MGVNSFPRTVTRQRRGCDLNPGLSPARQPCDRSPPHAAAVLRTTLSMLTACTAHTERAAAAELRRTLSGTRSPPAGDRRLSCAAAPTRPQPCRPIKSVAELGGGYTRSHKAAVARSDTADRLLLVARDVAFFAPLRNDIGANESWGTCGKFDSAIDAP